MPHRGKVLDFEQLTELGSRLLIAAGTNDDRARLVASQLAMSNMKGHDSHGVCLLPTYCEQVVGGIIAPNEEVTMVDESDTDIFDGHFTFGQITADVATKRLISVAKNHGSHSVSFGHSHHVGRVGHYAEEAAQAGLMILILLSTPEGKLVCHPNSRAALFGTNPICFAVTVAGRLILLDMATAMYAEGKLRVAKARDESAPKHMVRDHRGNPTRDAHVVRREQDPGSIMPLGGTAAYKGFGLALMVDLMAAAHGFGEFASSTATKGRNCAWMYAVDVSDNEYVRGNALTSWLTRLLEAETIDGETLTLPGDPEQAAFEERSEHGVTVEDFTCQQLLKAAKQVGASITDLVG